MTLIQFLPRRLAQKFMKPQPPKITSRQKKARQALPTLPKTKRPWIRFWNHESPMGLRILRRL